MAHKAGGGKKGSKSGGEVERTLLGTWSGGIWDGGRFQLRADGDGFVKGAFKSSDGSAVATVQGKLDAAGHTLQGLYTEGSGQPVGFTLKLGADGMTAEGTALTAGGAAQTCVVGCLRRDCQSGQQHSCATPSHRITGTRLVKGGRLPDGRLSTEGVYKNKEIFDRLTSRPASRQELREKVRRAAACAAEIACARHMLFLRSTPRR